MFKGFILEPMWCLGVEEILLNTSSIEPRDNKQRYLVVMDSSSLFLFGALDLHLTNLDRRSVSEFLLWTTASELKICSVFFFELFVANALVCSAVGSSSSSSDEWRNCFNDDVRFTSLFAVRFDSALRKDCDCCCCCCCCWYSLLPKDECREMGFVRLILPMAMLFTVVLEERTLESPAAAVAASRSESSVVSFVSFSRSMNCLEGL